LLLLLSKERFCGSNFAQYLNAKGFEASETKRARYAADLDRSKVVDLFRFAAVLTIRVHRSNPPLAGQAIPGLTV